MVRPKIYQVWPKERYLAVNPTASVAEQIVEDAVGQVVTKLNYQKTSLIHVLPHLFQVRSNGNSCSNKLKRESGGNCRSIFSIRRASCFKILLCLRTLATNILRSQELPVLSLVW